MRVGIVGCGSIAQVHSSVLSGMENITFAGAADINLERAQDICSRLGGNAYSSLDELLSSESLDVLHICTPHSLHVPMVEAAMKAGVAVFTEKPPAITYEQWNHLCEAGKQIPIGICFQNRYNDSVQHIKKLISRGDLGAFRGAKAFVTWQRDAKYYTESGWRGQWETEGGGVLINQAIHTMDLLVYLLGRPSSVEARMQNFHLSDVIEVEDTLEAYIKYDNSPVMFFATNAYAVNSPVMVEIAFESAVIRMEETEVSVFWTNGKKESKDFPPEKGVGKSYWGSGHKLCIRDFYDAMDNGKPLPIGLKDVADTMDLVLATYNSAKTEKQIKI